MKLACFTMFRNEAPILGPFLDQLGAFFDHATLLDHGSTDSGAATVRARAAGRWDVLRLQAPGYPQSEVATGMARRILEEQAPDFLFLLDCDEFLPFPDRAALEAFLAPFAEHDAVELMWRNACPEHLDGRDIFGGRFLEAIEGSSIAKVALNGRRLAGRTDWTVAQGYHRLRFDADAPVHLAVRAGELIHIPVQGRAQFRFKVAAGARRIRHDAALRSRGLGEHWLLLDDAAREGRLDEPQLRDLALAYPELPDAPVPARPLDFAFPYIASPSREDADSILGQVEGLLVEAERAPGSTGARAFAVLDDAGAVVLSAAGAATPPAPAGPTPPPILFEGTLGEDYAALVEPLFNLPARVPPGTAWAGHVPFLFALFRNLRPATYVELGVHMGGSLLAAATAARTYGTGTRCFGVDTWQGDEHAGQYEGDRIHAELRDYAAGAFPDVTLLRSLFREARGRFRPGSIDVLHIDGLHTYDAVKEDFSTWFGLMAPAGVVLFHDICVLERGFGVHRLWAELRRHFPTIEFHHAFGLGVLFLAPEDERFAPFRRLMASEAAMAAYRSLAADVAEVLGERMDGFASHDAPAAALEDLQGQLDRQIEETERLLAELLREQRQAREVLDTVAAREAQILAMHDEIQGMHEQLRERDAWLAELRASTSWRVTGPLRRARRLLGG